MSRSKTKSALSAALKHLEDALNTLSKNGAEEPMSDLLWSASAAVEYALFLLSLILGDKAENAPWKNTFSSKSRTELKPVLTTAFELLNEAKTDLESHGAETSYEESWKARNLLMRAQELLERKLKERKK